MEIVLTVTIETDLEPSELAAAISQLISEDAEINAPWADVVYDPPPTEYREDDPRYRMGKIRSGFKRIPNFEPEKQGES